MNSMKETQFNVVERAHLACVNPSLDNDVVTQESDEEISSVGSYGKRLFNASRGGTIHSNNGSDLMSQVCGTYVHNPHPMSVFLTGYVKTPMSLTDDA